jgi:hypothetical protein
MKVISQDERRGFNKYKLNYAYVNYNNKTGFYKNTREAPANTYEHPNIHHWMPPTLTSILFVAFAEHPIASQILLST